MTSLQPTDTTTNLASLSEEQKVRLCEQEGILQEHYFGHRQFMRALYTIYEEGLYVEHGSFPNYVKTRWVAGWTDFMRFSDKRLYQLMAGQEAIEDVQAHYDQQSVSTNGRKSDEDKPKIDILLPSNERQARELLKAPKEERGKVFERAVDLAKGKVPSARIIAQARQQVCPKQMVLQSPEDREEEVKRQQIMVDKAVKAKKGRLYFSHNPGGYFLTGYFDLDNMPGFCSWSLRDLKKAGVPIKEGFGE